MAINIEVKHALRALEARIKALEERPQSIISKETLEELAKLEASWKQDAAPQAPRAGVGQNPDGQTDLPSDTPAVSASHKKMCPKCGVKPAYFFHVRACKG